MIKNSWGVPAASTIRARALACAALAWAASGCGRASAGMDDDALQGVVEFDDRRLGFELAGRVHTVSLARGDLVRAGAEVATLDDSLERPARAARAAEVEAAQAQVRLLRAGARPQDVRATEAQIRGLRATEGALREDLARTRRLAAQGAVATAGLDDLDAQLTRTGAERAAQEERLALLHAGARPQEIDAAQARVRAAEAALAAEDERLTRYTLRSPLDGVVMEVHADPGEVTAPGTPVLTVADTAHPYVDVFVAQGHLAGVRAGAPAVVRVDATREPFHGHVEHVGQRTEFTPRYLFSERERPNLVVRVRVRVEDPRGALHAGVPAFVTVQHGR